MLPVCRASELVWAHHFSLLVLIAAYYPGKKKGRKCQKEGQTTAERGINRKKDEKDPVF